MTDETQPPTTPDPTPAKKRTRATKLQAEEKRKLTDEQWMHYIVIAYGCLIMVVLFIKLLTLLKISV